MAIGNLYFKPHFKSLQNFHPASWVCHQPTGNVGIELIEPTNFQRDDIAVQVAVDFDTKDKRPLGSV